MMPITMFNIFVPTATQVLRALSRVLEKAEAHALEHKIDPSILLNARLFPNMYPLCTQVQIACDFAKGAAARLSGSDNPAFLEAEKSFAELSTRIAKTLAFVNSVDAKKFEVSETRDITLKVGGVSPRLKASHTSWDLYFPI